MTTGFPSIHLPITRNSDPTPAFEWHFWGRYTLTSFEFMADKTDLLESRISCDNFILIWVNSTFGFSFKLLMDPLNMKSDVQKFDVISSSEQGLHSSESLLRSSAEATGVKWYESSKWSRHFSWDSCASRNSATRRLDETKHLMRLTSLPSEESYSLLSDGPLDPST